MMRGACVNIPALPPYVGDEETTTKRFFVSHSSTDAASVVDNKRSFDTYAGNFTVFRLADHTGMFTTRDGRHVLFVLRVV